MATAPDQGIMALPENQNMNRGPRLSLEETSDAVQQGLQNASPEAAQAVKSVTADLAAKFDGLTDKQLDLFIQLLQYLYDNPEEYQKVIGELVSKGGMEAGVFPEEHDPELLATMLYAAMEAKRNRGMGGEEAAPAMEPPPGMAMGGIADAARMVASRGRAGDTMLAHITPEEARMLRARGGAGTINPATGLPEYGFFLDEVFDFIKEVTDPIVKPIVKVAKEIVKSPVGKILATVALTVALGPAGLGLEAALAAPLASAGTTLLAGGDLKDALIAGATSYFGAPGGVVSDFVGSMGVTNAAMNAAVTNGVVGTGAALLSGKKFEDAIKTGMTQGAIGAVTNVAGKVAKGMTLGEALESKFDIKVDSVKDASTTTEKPLTPETAAQDVVTPKTVEQQIAASRSLDTTPVDQSYGVLDPTQLGLTDPEGALAEAQRAWAFDPLVVSNQKFAGFKQATAPLAPLDAKSQATAPAPTRSLASQAQPVKPGIAGLSPTAPQVPQYTPTTISGQLGKMGSAIMDGEFGQAYEAGKELLFPSSATPEQIAQIKTNAEQAYLSRLDPQYRRTPTALSGAVAAGEKAVEAATTEPGMFRTYAPLAAAGVGALALTGGFQPSPVEDPGLVERDEEGNPITGLDLMEQNPSKYEVQNLPGVRYNARGQIIGYGDYVPGYGMSDVTRQTEQVGGGIPGQFVPFQLNQQDLFAGRSPRYYDYMRRRGQDLYGAGAYPFAVPRAEGSPPQGEQGIGSLMASKYPRRNGAISGPGTGTSDDVPAMLSDGEFVMTAKAVRGMGNGSRREGAKRMYALMHKLENNLGRA